MSSLATAELLYARRRFGDAEAALLQHLAADPDDPDAHALLAQTQLRMPGRRRDALDTIGNAIALEADRADFFAVKAMILSVLDQEKQALAAADEAIRLDPDLVIGWVMKAQALGGMSQWAEAERAARHALSLDPDNEDAQNALAVYLRMQGRLEESARGVDQRLARAPEDPRAHANYGWAALHSGDPKKAEEHFREALRLEPDLEYARTGLRETYKARSPLYRLFLRWVFFMQRFSEGQRWAIIIGIFLGVKFGRAVLEQFHPLAAMALVVLYLLFCFWSFLASGTGHALMLADRSARLTLNFRERLDGLFVGIFFVLGLALVVLGTTVLPAGVAFLGAALALGAIPCSRIFLNESRAGHLVFGGIALLIYAAGIASLLAALDGSAPFEHPVASQLIPIALLAGVLTTWIAGVPALNSAAEE